MQALGSEYLRSCLDKNLPKRPLWRTYRIYENCWRAAGSYRVRSLCLVYIVVCTTTSCVLLRNLLGNRNGTWICLKKHFTNCPFLGPFLWKKCHLYPKIGVVLVRIGWNMMEVGRKNQLWQYNPMTRALKKTQNILIWSSNQKYVGVI